MRRPMLMDACRLAAAIVVGIVVLAASGTAVAVDPDIALGRWPIAGEPVVCVASGRSTPGDPFSTLAQASGDFLLVRWGGAGWGLLWLSGDGRTVRRLEADVPTGRVTGAVRLGNGRVLVTAEQGLFAVDGDRRLQRIAGCEQIGMALFIVRRDGGALSFPDGSALLAGERGLLRLSPEGRIERLGELPADASDFEVVGGDAVLVSGIFGHVLMARDGRTSLVATGARAQSFVAVRGAQPAWRSSPPFRLFSTPPPPRAMALMDRGGRTTWAKLPDDVRNVSYPVELDDGRIFWVTDRGLLRLRNDGTLQRVSAAVRLACGDARGGDGETIVQAMAGGRTLVHADGLLFIIDRKDRVQPVVGQVDCAKRLYRRGFAATNDGSVYFEVEEALYRRNPGGRVRALPVAGTTGTIYSIKTFGDDVLVSAKEGLFHTRSGRSLRRIVPKGHDAELHSTVNDLDGRPLICVDKNVLHRLDAHGDLQPLRAAAGVDCGGWVSRAGSLGLLMLPGGKASPVLVTRDERAIIIPGARVWPVAQLRDGSMILMSLPANPGESWIPGREEESSLPHSLILVSPQGRIEPVAFDGPEVELKPQRDPTWQERSAVRAVHFTSPMLGWAVLGKRGLLSTTVDAGAQWRGVTSDNVPIVGVASLAFTADGRHGIAAGKDALWRTDDAGATWTKTPWQSEIFDVHQIRLLGSAGARAVAVVDRRDHDNIVVELWVSDDGGRTWVAPALPVPGPLAWARNQMAGVGFDAAGRGGWLVAADRLLVTGDGGNTWQQFADLRDYREVEGRRWRLEQPRLVTRFGQNLVAQLPGSPVDMAIWALGETWCIARWKLFCVSPNVERPKSGVQEVAIDPDALVAALAVEPDGKRGWAVGTQGLILATEDRGKTWSPQPSGVRGTLWGIYFLPDALHGWAWGEDGILLTRDGGKSWQPARAN